MAAKTSTKSKATAKGKSSKKEAPAPEAVDEDLEEIEDDEVEETGSKGGQEEVTFGASDLAKHLSERSGKSVSARELRTLIRKMARDGTGRVDREIVPGNRSRYNWSGLDDPEVKAIIKAFNAGELEADKKEKLDALKARKAEKKAAKDKDAKKGKKGKGKKSEPVAEADDSDDDEDLELDDDDDE